MTNQEKAFQQLIHSMPLNLFADVPVDLLREFFNLGWQAGQALWNSSNFDEWWGRDVVPNQPSNLPDWFIKLMKLAAYTGWVDSLRVSPQKGSV